MDQPLAEGFTRALGAALPEEQPRLDLCQEEEAHPHHDLGQPGLVDEEEGSYHHDEIDEPEGVPNGLDHVT